MLRSHIIEIDGVFVGAAVHIDRGYRFVATDLRLEDIDSTTWPTLADIRRVARRLIQATTFAGPIASGCGEALHTVKDR